MDQQSIDLYPFPISIQIVFSHLASLSLELHFGTYVSD